MFPDESQDLNYDKLMEFLAGNKLCCNINFDIRVFGQKSCWDCFKKIRVQITDIHLNWEISSTQNIIRWYNDSQ